MSPSQLADYVVRQTDHFFPDGQNDARDLVPQHIGGALERMEPSVRLARVWPKDQFSHLHSNQYAVFLYYLSNTIWRLTQNEAAASKVFYLNKALHAFECFYSIDLPDIFCVCHSPGIVLAQATYANYLVLYQNSTVGRVTPSERPVFGEGVVMFPNTAVIGRSVLGPRTYIAQGQSVINATTPGNCVVFNDGPKLQFREPKTDFLKLFFRIDED